MSGKNHKKLFIFLIILVILTCAGLSGYIIAKNEPRIVDAVDDSPSAVPVGADDIRISQDATVEWDYEYTMCCHHIYVNCAVDEDMVGLTFTELQDRFLDVKIIEFDSDMLVLKKTFDCYCPDHFLLKKYHDILAIYRTTLGTDKQYVYMEVSIPFDTIDADEKHVLEVGKIFTDLDDIEHYLEDIET